VIAKIPGEVEKIFVVDDACTEGSGDHVESNCRDPRVIVLRNVKNLGVGGAVIRGYKEAIRQEFSVVIKIDGDGQMDGSRIMSFVSPIRDGKADYTKGNRFYQPESTQGMPKIRLLGNAVLSFMTKISSGYWDIFDPTNGFTAISVPVLKHLSLHKINERYFFESDMLFRLNIIRAVLMDIPMDAQYGSEKSNLRIRHNMLLFLKGNICNFGKRLFYNYYLRNFSLASLQLIVGILLLLFGTSYGLVHWADSISTNAPATAGTVMVAALPVIMGFELLMSFINYDINTVPRQPLTPILQN